jgi:hypothetical protein
LKVTTPFGAIAPLAGVTVAVNVIDWPNHALLALLDSEVDVPT